MAIATYDERHGSPSETRDSRRTAQEYEGIPRGDRPIRRGKDTKQVQEPGRFPYLPLPSESTQIENPYHSVCMYLSLWILSSLSPIRVSVLVGALSSPTLPSRRWVFFQHEASTQSLVTPQNP